MKLRIALRGSEAAFSKQKRIVEINRRIGHRTGRIDIDYLDIFADWTRQESVLAASVTLPGNVDYGFVDKCRF